MLDVLRRNAGSWVIKGILTFIALTFVWWGIGSFAERGRSVAATVGSEKISLGELDQATVALEKTYRDVYGDAFTPDMQKALHIRRQALDSLIQKTLMMEDARSMHLVASDLEVQRDIASTPAFQENGQFREDRYLGLLSYNRMSPADFEERKREEITLRKIEGLFHLAGRVSEAEARERFDVVSRKVKLLVAIADPASLRNVPPPTDVEIAAAYAQSKENYRLPARVKLLVARFVPARFAGGTQPADIEKGKDVAVVKVYEARGKAASSRDLKAVCTSYGIATEETGWLDDKTPGELPPVVVSEAMMQPLKEIGPVKSVGDVHYLYQVVGKEESRVPSLSEVRSKVAEALFAVKRRDAAQAAARKIATSGKTASDIEKAAKQEGLSVATTAFFEPMSETVPEALKGIPASDRRALSTLGPKSPVFSSAIHAGGRFLAIAFLEEQAPDANEWSTKKDAFIRNLEEKRRTETLEAYVLARQKESRVKINDEAVK